VESGTAPKASEAVNGASANGAGAERIEVLNPANGSTVGSVEVASPERVAEVVARVRANQAEWEAIGIEGRYRWLGKLRDWLFDNHERVLDTMQRETGKVRGDTTAETVYLTDLINFYGTKAEKFIGDETVRIGNPGERAFGGDLGFVFAGKNLDRLA